MTFFLEMIRLGLGNLWLHKLRSFLTALGIILGIAAVIVMVAIGEGQKRDALERVERLGAKNIIIRSQPPPQETQSRGGQQNSRVSRYGLTRADFAVLKDTFAFAEHLVPLKEVGGQILKDDLRVTSQAYGTVPELADVARLGVARGRYLVETDVQSRAGVCVLGSEVARKLFPFEDPLGNTIRIDENVFRVIGVLEPVGLSGGAGTALVGRDLNLDVHIPLTTALEQFGDMITRRSSGSFSRSEVQVSEVYLSAPERDEVLTYAALAKRILDTRHPGLTDVSMIVPFELLENARRTAIAYTAVTAIVAGIALLVGGIGIMNIMLATVTERTREIGIRRALGATREHISRQFLIETGVLCVLGGLTGVATGVGLSVGLRVLVPHLPDLPWIGRFMSRDFTLTPHVTLWSILVSFSIACAVGLIFGIYPAVKASRQDPIVALRRD